MQLVQVLTNYWACFEMIFANGHDYQQLPAAHQSLTTWQGMFYGGVLITIRHLQHPNIIAVWEEHCHATAGQGL